MPMRSVLIMMRILCEIILKGSADYESITLKTCIFTLLYFTLLYTMFNKKNTIIMVKKLIYTSGLILSISISMLLSSCSKDELNINQKNLNEGEVTSIDTRSEERRVGN